MFLELRFCTFRIWCERQALRAYRMLRPDAAPFYEEDAMLGMKAEGPKGVEFGQFETEKMQSLEVFVRPR